MEAHYQLARVYEALETKKAHSLAIKAYQKAISMDPARTEIYRALANFLVKLDKFPDARRTRSRSGTHINSQAHKPLGASCKLMIEDARGYDKDNSRPLIGAPDRISTSHPELGAL